MPNRPTLETQRRLLQSLGFAFLEAPFVPPVNLEERPSKPAAAPPPPRESAPRRAAPAAAAPASFERTAAATLDELAAVVRSCQNCALGKLRRQAIAGTGAQRPQLLAIAEGPTLEEEATGQPLAGSIGEMARRLFGAMKLADDQWWYTSAVKCAPPMSRAPNGRELAACAGHLRAEVALLEPRLILCFGAAAEESLFGSVRRAPRGTWREYQSIPVLVTHPLPFVFDRADRKRELWADVQQAIARLQ
jgi:DNA polymerase